MLRYDEPRGSGSRTNQVAQVGVACLLWPFAARVGFAADMLIRNIYNVQRIHHTSSIDDYGACYHGYVEEDEYPST